MEFFFFVFFSLSLWVWRWKSVCFCMNNTLTHTYSDWMELIKLKSIIQLISHSSVSRNSQELTTFNTQIIGRFTRISSQLALYGVDKCCSCHEISSSTQLYELKYHTHLTSYRCCCFKDTRNGVSMGDTKEGNSCTLKRFCCFLLNFTFSPLPFAYKFHTAQKMVGGEVGEKKSKQ